MAERIILAKVVSCPAQNRMGTGDHLLNGINKNEEVSVCVYFIVCTVCSRNKVNGPQCQYLEDGGLTFD